MLKRLRYADYEKGINVEAFTDGYAYDGYSYLYLLSVAGYEARVKAITSALATGREVEILEDSLCLSSDPYQKYKVLSSRMSSGLLHQILLAENFFKFLEKGSKLLYIDKKKHAPEIVYSIIKKNYAVPLIPEWAKWLYQKMKQENCLEELLGTKQVVKLFVSEEELDSFISEGVKNGEIRF